MDYTAPDRYAAPYGSHANSGLTPQDPYDIVTALTDRSVNEGTIHLEPGVYSMPGSVVVEWGRQGPVTVEGLGAVLLFPDWIADPGLILLQPRTTVKGVGLMADGAAPTIRRPIGVHMLASQCQLDAVNLFDWAIGAKVGVLGGDLTDVGSFNCSLALQVLSRAPARVTDCVFVSCGQTHTGAVEFHGAVGAYASPGLPDDATPWRTAGDLQWAPTVASDKVVLVNQTGRVFDRFPLKLPAGITVMVCPILRPGVRFFTSVSAFGDLILPRYCGPVVAPRAVDGPLRETCGEGLYWVSMVGDGEGE